MCPPDRVRGLIDKMRNKEVLDSIVHSESGNTILHLIAYQYQEGTVSIYILYELCFKLILRTDFDH